ncbi:MAG: PRC-barrel domain-containing protein [Anaerolineaceae bacterium]
MSMAPTNLTTGAEVYTTDGEKLGTVKTIRGDRFQVDAPMQRDYWLLTACVGEASGVGGRVTVTFDKDHLDDSKQEMTEDSR